MKRKYLLSGVNRWTVAALLATAFSVFSHGFALHAILPFIHRELQVGGDRIDLVFYAYYIPLIILLVPFTLMLDRGNYKNPLLAGLGVMVGGLVLALVSRNISHLIAAEMIIGTGAALAIPHTFNLVLTLFNGVARRRVIWLLVVAFFLAAAMAPVLIGMVVANGLGQLTNELLGVTKEYWRYAFYGNVAAGAISLALVARFVPKRNTGQEYHKHDVMGIFSAIAGTARQNKLLLPCSLLSGVFLAALSGLVYLIMLYGTKARGLSPAVSGSLLLPVGVICLVPTRRLIIKFLFGIKESFVSVPVMFFLVLSLSGVFSGTVAATNLIDRLTVKEISRFLDGIGGLSPSLRDRIEKTIADGTYRLEEHGLEQAIGLEVDAILERDLPTKAYVLTLPEKERLALHDQVMERQQKLYDSLSAAYKQVTGEAGKAQKQATLKSLRYFFLILLISILGIWFLPRGMTSISSASVPDMVAGIGESRGSNVRRQAKKKRRR